MNIALWITIGATFICAFAVFVIRKFIKWRMKAMNNKIMELIRAYVNRYKKIKELNRIGGNQLLDLQVLTTLCF